MKRLIPHLLTLSLLTIGGFGGLVTENAMAQGPHVTYRGQATAPQVVVYSGGGGYGANYGGYGAGYGPGYVPYVAPITPYYYPQNVPYGAGYSGGYAPYREMYLQRLYYGLGN